MNAVAKHERVVIEPNPHYADAGKLAVLQTDYRLYGPRDIYLIHRLWDGSYELRIEVIQEHDGHDHDRLIGVFEGTAKQCEKAARRLMQYEPDLSWRHTWFDVNYDLSPAFKGLKGRALR